MKSKTKKTLKDKALSIDSSMLFLYLYIAISFSLLFFAASLRLISEPNAKRISFFFWSTSLFLSVVPGIIISIIRNKKPDDIEYPKKKTIKICLSISEITVFSSLSLLIIHLGVIFKPLFALKIVDYLNTISEILKYTFIISFFMYIFLLFTQFIVREKVIKKERQEKEIKDIEKCDLHVIRSNNTTKEIFNFLKIIFFSLTMLGFIIVILPYILVEYNPDIYMNDYISNYMHDLVSSKGGIHDFLLTTAQKLFPGSVFITVIYFFITKIKNRDMTINTIVVQRTYKTNEASFNTLLKDYRYYVVKKYPETNIYLIKKDR